MRMRRIRRIILICGIFMFVLLGRNNLLAEKTKEDISFEEKHKDKMIMILLNNLEVDVHDDWTYTKTINRIIL